MRIEGKQPRWHPDDAPKLRPYDEAGQPLTCTSGVEITFRGVRESVGDIREGLAVRWVDPLRKV